MYVNILKSSSLCGGSIPLHMCGGVWVGRSLLERLVTFNYTTVIHLAFPAVVTKGCSLQLQLIVTFPVAFLAGNTAHLYPAQDKQKCIHISLLYSDNGSGLNAADKIKSMTSVGATQITLTQDGKYHQLALYVDSAGMESLWKVVWGGSGLAAIHVGLLAVRLEGGVTMWLSGNSSSGTGGGSKGEGVPTQQQLAAMKQEKSGE